MLMLVALSLWVSIFVMIAVVFIFPQGRSVHGAILENGKEARFAFIGEGLLDVDDFKERIVNLLMTCDGFNREAAERLVNSDLSFAYSHIRPVERGRLCKVYETCCRTEKGSIFATLATVNRAMEQVLRRAA